MSRPKGRIAAAGIIRHLRKIGQREYRVGNRAVGHMTRLDIGVDGESAPLKGVNNPVPTVGYGARLDIGVDGGSVAIGANGRGQQGEDSDYKENADKQHGGTP